VRDPILDLPVQSGAPWPQMRRDRRNTARSPIVGAYRRGTKPWTVTLEKGIFNTPVVDRAGTSYIGSAAGVLWAVDRRGKVLWKFRTGGLLDAGGVLAGDSLVFGSGDEMLYRVRLTRRRLTQRRRTIWTFKSPTRPATGQLLNYWEGPLSLAPNGDILAGNTGGGAYRIDQRGRMRWVYQTANSVWTAPATADDGTTFWGSVDRSFFALGPDGRSAWSFPSLGFVTASPSIGSDGTVYTASFDGKVYALDPRTGLPKWTFQTRDHVYAGPALAQDAGGATTVIVVGSTDGGLYGLSTAGRQLWRYETADPIRSSPAIGVASDGKAQIAYVGSSNGRLYAIDVATGGRRWSYDTTPNDPVLRDRNDLNGSPALTFDGIVIGGEHGVLTRVPYDWCLQPRARADRRCSTDPQDELPANLSRVAYVTPGGNTRVGATPTLAGATTVAGRLLVRENGATVDAGAFGLLGTRALVSAEPDFPHTTTLSGDGAFMFVQPDGFLAPDRQYTLHYDGTWLADGIALANTPIGATRSGRFADTISFRTRKLGRAPSLAVTRDRVSALEITRLAVPLPPLLPSVNQIGFDQYDLIAGLVRLGAPDAQGERSVLLWVVGGKRGAHGRLVADPKAGFAFPLTGRLRGDEFLLRRDGLTLQFSFGSVPLRRFELRGSLTRRLDTRAGASLYTEVTCNDVPNYGPLLLITGICTLDGNLIAAGTFLTHRYDRRGGASSRPADVTASDLRVRPPTALAAGEVHVALRADGYRADDHVVSILLIDTATGSPVGIDYQGLTSVERNGAGDVSGARVRIPRGSALPARLQAVVMTDAFPLATQTP
jgi:outer membrane protein assembly factor BamB